MQQAADIKYQQLYLHIPFCAQRCDYCDFATSAQPANSQKIDEYTIQLISQIRKASRDGVFGELQTIYIGGGTPTHIGKHLVNLAYTLSLSINLHEDTEFTVECNPESLTVQLIKDLYALGVNRFSIGVQSFIDSELASVGRIHNSEQAIAAVRAAQQRAQNVSVDLMCGLPGQTLASWRQSVQTAVKLDLAHISVYPLTLEDKTPLAQRYYNGKLELPNEDTQAEMMQAAAQILAVAGYERYEVASYAKPGYACKHNIGYWTGKSYLGLGSAAHSMLNTASGRERYCEQELLEALSPTQALAEDLMLGMRMAQGISDELMQAATIAIPTAVALFAELEQLGLITHNTARWRPTQRGWLMGNEIYSRILSLVPNK